MASATSASCQSRRAVTASIVTSVTAAASAGITPSTVTYWMAGASCWMR